MAEQIGGWKAPRELYIEVGLLLREAIIDQICFLLAFSELRGWGSTPTQIFWYLFPPSVHVHVLSSFIPIGSGYFDPTSNI